MALPESLERSRHICSNKMSSLKGEHILILIPNSFFSISSDFSKFHIPFDFLNCFGISNRRNALEFTKNASLSEHKRKQQSKNAVNFLVPNRCRCNLFVFCFESVSQAPSFGQSLNLHHLLQSAPATIFSKEDACNSHLSRTLALNCWPTQLNKTGWKIVTI